MLDPNFDWGIGFHIIPTRPGIEIRLITGYFSIEWWRFSPSELKDMLKPS
jgi:hypothetical protein